MSTNYIYSNSQESQRRSTKLRRMRIQFATLFLLLIFVISGILISTTTTASVTTPTPVDVTESKKLASANNLVDAGGQSQSATTPVKKTAATIAPIPNCNPSTNTVTPAAPVLNSTSSGLIITPTIESRYTVYGGSASQISNQIFRCSPVVSNGSRFAASAEYVMNWSFQYTSNETGLCNVTNASVGLGTSKTLPKWQPVNAASTTLQKRWNSYIANLNSHEEGHLNLDRKYAEKILTELRNYPPTSCDSINTSANARANALVAELNRANDQYDSNTDHGSTEGADL